MDGRQEFQALAFLCLSERQDSMLWGDLVWCQDLWPVSAVLGTETEEEVEKEEKEEKEKEE